MKKNILVLAATLLLTADAFGFGLKDLEVKSAELQWAICEDSPVEFIKKLGVTVKSVKVNQFSLFDTKDLRLFKNGVFLRLRGQDEVYESTTKIRINNFNQIPAGYNNKDVKCEVDMYRDETKTSCSLNFDGAQYEKLVSPEQIEFLKAVAPAGTSLMGIKEFGPHINSIFKILQNYDGYEVKVDYLKVSQTKSFTEISFRVPLDKANYMFAKFSGELFAKKVKLCDEQVGRAAKIFKY